MSNNRAELRGKIVFYLPSKGYGFIREFCPACGSAPNIGKGRMGCPACDYPLHDDYFFYTREDERKLVENSEVTFSLSAGDRPRALNVELAR